MKKHNFPVCAAFCGRPVVAGDRKCFECQRVEKLEKDALAMQTYSAIFQVADRETRGVLWRQWGEMYAPELVKLLTTGEIADQNKNSNLSQNEIL